MASSVFSLKTSTASRDSRPKRYPSTNSACENCHARKQRCVAGPGSCQACASLGIECKPREHNRLGRPRGARQSEWRAEVNNKPHGRRASHKSFSQPTPSAAFSQQGDSPSMACALSTLEDFDPASASLRLSPSTSNSTSSIDTFPWETYFGGLGNLDTVQASLSPEDVELHNIHYKIRSAIGIHRNADSIVASDRNTQHQSDIAVLEELSETLHKLPWNRTMLLFGVAVLWDALELSVNLSSSIINPLDNSPMSATPLLQTGLPMDQDLEFSALMSNTAPSSRSRQGADVVSLTRLGVCLGDFSTFAKNLKNYGGDSAAPAQQAIGDCRRRIAAVHDNITRHIHMVTNTWSGGGKEH